ncbi:MAG: hypothetical protein K2I76_03325 [Malacoplasma sp.]|nr:hypothetical protein [Malacoplasma sp.]
MFWSLLVDVVQSSLFESISFFSSSIVFETHWPDSSLYIEVKYNACFLFGSSVKSVSLYFKLPLIFGLLTISFTFPFFSLLSS